MKKAIYKYDYEMRNKMKEVLNIIEIGSEDIARILKISHTKAHFYLENDVFIPDKYMDKLINFLSKYYNKEIKGVMLALELEDHSPYELQLQRIKFEKLKLVQRYTRQVLRFTNPSRLKWEAY